MNNHRFNILCLFFLLGGNLYTSLAQMEPVRPDRSMHDTIQVACEPDYPPYCYVNEFGRPEGFAVDVFAAAARAVKLNFKMDIGLWNHIKNDLASGNLDALPFVGRTPEREDIFDFTLSFLSLHGAIFVRKGNTGIKSLADLKDKKLVVMAGDNAEEFMRREHLSDDITTTNTFEEAFELLSSGEYDATITQRITGLELIKENKIRNVKALDLPLPEFRQDFCFAVQEGDSHLLNLLNEGLSIIIANDTYNTIRQEWLGATEQGLMTVSAVIRRILPYLIAATLIIAIAFILFLRSEVKSRTRKLKKSEEQIRLLLNSTAEGIYSLDLDGNCTLINRSGVELLGYQHTDEILGKNMHDLIHHHHPDGSVYPPTDCPIHFSFMNDQKTSGEEEFFFRKDGTSFQVEFYSHPIRSKGKVIGSVVTFWDNSERKKNQQELIRLKDNLEIEVRERTTELEEKIKKLNESQKAMLIMVEDLNQITEELKQERKSLKRSNDDLEAFTHSVSHDLRAPLRAINGFANFLAEDYGDQLDQEGHRYIHTIRQNATRMDALIADLLSLSRISRSLLKLKSIDMAAMAHEAFDEIATDQEKKDFTLEIGPLHTIEGDPVLMKQVWINLVSNAVKYSTRSPIKKIEIESSENENEVTFSIKDYGAGFNEAYKDKLFGIFQRLHRESDFEGVGVGLAIVKRIINRHHGEVWGEGEENKGAKFFFTMPK